MSDEIEIWKDIPNYEGLYQASNEGNIKSLYCRYHNKVIILKATKISSGYFAVTLCKNKIRKTETIHMMVIWAFYGVCEYLDINHKDGDKANNKLDNLEYVSRRENIHHAMKMKQWPRGEKHGMARLNEYQVTKIRELNRIGVSYTKLAIQFSSSKANISRIILKKTWKSLA